MASLKSEEVTMKIKIDNYRTNDTLTQSPCWIWFSKLDPQQSKCLICKRTIPRKDSTTTAMISHMRYRHGSNSGYNAWIIYEELSELRDLRMKAKRQAALRKIPFKKAKSERRGKRKRNREALEMVTQVSGARHESKSYAEDREDMEQEELEEQEDIKDLSESKFTPTYRMQIFMTATVFNNVYHS